MYEDLMKAYADATDELYSVSTKVYKAEYALREALAQQYDLKAETLTLGHWECPDSPIKRCVYNQDVDPCCDDCIICHDPEERK